jgi:hypothetical protein
VQDPRDDRRTGLSTSRTILGLVGVVVPTAVATSQGRPVSTVALLGIAIVLAFIGIRRLLTKRDQRGSHPYRTLGCMLAGMLLATVLIIVAIPSLRTFAAFDLLGFGHAHTKLLTLDISEDRSAYRITAVLANDSTEPEVVSQIVIGSTFDYGMGCAGARYYYYRVRSHVHVVSRTRSGAVLRVEIGDGTPFYRWATGYISGKCGIGQLRIASPSSVVVPSRGLATVSIDVPRQLVLVGLSETEPAPLPVKGDGFSPAGYLRLELTINGGAKPLSRCVRIAHGWDGLDQMGLTCSSAGVDRR